jgi:hypothetical protein
VPILNPVREASEADDAMNDEPVGMYTPTSTVEEVERPTFLALVRFLQLLNPELSLALTPALDVGIAPVRPVVLSPDAADVINWFINTVWGANHIVIPIITPVTTTTDQYGIPTPCRSWSQSQPCSGLSVYVQPFEVSSASPYENRVLNIKGAYKRSTPEEAIRMGIELSQGQITKPLMLTPRVVEASGGKRNRVTGSLKWMMSKRA